MSLKNTALSPKRHLFRNPDKSPPSAFTTSVSTNQGSMRQSFVAFEEPKKQNAISVLREELQMIKSEVARLIDDGPPSNKIDHLPDSERKEEKGFGKKELTRKQTNLPMSPRFARRKPNSPVDNLPKSSDQFAKVKTEIEKVKLELRKTTERESRYKAENEELQHTLKIMKKSNEKLEKEVKILTMQIQQVDNQRKNEEKAYFSLKKQFENSLRKVKELEDERGKLIESLRIFDKKQIDFNKEKEKLNNIITMKQKEVARLNNLLNEEKLKERAEETKIYESKVFQVVQKKIVGCQTEGGVEDRMCKQIAYLWSQIKGREKAMQMMLGDIRGMERDLKIVNNLHWEIGEQKQLIEEVNEDLMQKQAELLNLRLKARYNAY